MSRSPSRSLFKKVGLAALLGVAGVGAVFYGRWILSVDPFAKYRPVGAQPDPQKQYSVNMKDVRFTLYDETKKLATCDVGEVKIRRDRQVYELVGVKNGQMVASEGSFGFEAKTAQYEQRTKSLTALDGARIWSKDLNLKADGFAYYQRAKSIQTVGKVTGAFFGGTLTAMNFRYNPVERSGTAGPVEWTGDLAKKLGDAPLIQGSSKPWQVKGKRSEWKGDIRTFYEARASDGEVIVLADKVVQDAKSDVITATGHVKYFSSRANMACEQAVVYRKEKRAVLTGSVTMLVKPKEQEKLEETTIAPFRPMVPESIASTRPAAPTPEEKQQNDEVRQNNFRKYPTQIWAERVEYFYAKGSRHANVSGSPQARQDLPNGRWRHVWTTTAAFDVEADKLKLMSGGEKKTTRLITSVGDDLIAKWIEVSTKEGGEDEMEGEDVEGTVVSDDEDLNNRNQNPPPPAGKKPPLNGRIGA